MLERLIERFLFAGRWLLLFSVKFFQELLHLVPVLSELHESDLILAALSLADLVLVGNLLVMVVLSGYENFVSRIDHANGEISWLGKVDAGTLKIKVAASIVAISSIHLLKAFVKADSIANDKLMWLVIIHLTFVVSALLLAFVDKIAFAIHREH